MKKLLCTFTFILVIIGFANSQEMQNTAATAKKKQFIFNEIPKEKAQDYVNNYKYSNQYKGFYAVAFLNDVNVGDKQEQKHLKGMFNTTDDVEIIVNGNKPKGFDSRRFYIGMDSKNQFVCVMVYTLWSNSQYSDIFTNYYVCEYCEIHKMSSSLIILHNHRTCEPTCPGASI